MKTVYIPAGATYNYETLVTDDVIVHGHLHVTNGLKAKHIFGRGFITAGEVSADIVDVTELECGTVICRRLLAQRVSVNEAMISESAAVSATPVFKDRPIIPVTPVTPSKPSQKPDTGKNLPFTDVSANNWFYDGVKYAYENGLMNGTSSNAFSPNANTTRGMIVTILARVEGVNTNGTPWYAAGQKWAMDNGISDGTNMPGVITREQLATILYRYAKQKGYDVSKSAALTAFSDADKVSGYAAEAMQWAVAEGLLQGSNGRLNPQGSATRAQVATILMRFMEKIAK